MLLVQLPYEYFTHMRKTNTQINLSKLHFHLRWFVCVTQRQVMIRFLKNKILFTILHHFMKNNYTDFNHIIQNTNMNKHKTESAVMNVWWWWLFTQLGVSANSWLSSDQTLSFQSSSQVTVEVDQSAGHSCVHRRLRQHPSQVRLDVSGQYTELRVRRRHTEPATRMIEPSNEACSLLVMLHAHTAGQQAALIAGGVGEIHKLSRRDDVPQLSSGGVFQNTAVLLRGLQDLQGRDHTVPVQSEGPGTDEVHDPLRSLCYESFSFI